MPTALRRAGSPVELVLLPFPIFLGICAIDRVELELNVAIMGNAGPGEIVLSEIPEKAEQYPGKEVCLVRRRPIRKRDGAKMRMLKVITVLRWKRSPRYHPAASRLHSTR